VHKFKYKHNGKEGDDGGEPRAFILGVSGNGYRLWGPCKQGSLATTYYEFITLEETPTYVKNPSGMPEAVNEHSSPEKTDGSGESEPQKPARTSSTGATGQRPPFHRKLSHRPSSGQMTSSQAHDGNSGDIYASNVALNGEVQPSASGIHAFGSSAVLAPTSAQVSESLVPTPTPLVQAVASGQHHVPTNLANQISVAKPDLTPHQSATDVQQPGHFDFQKLYDDAEEYLATLEDDTGSAALDTNKDLSKRLKWLEDAAVKKDERMFKIMWKGVNRVLKDADFTELPKL
jgi:hypothetical protein